MSKAYKIDLAEHCLDIPDLPGPLDGLRIAHFGDLHAPKPVPFLEQVNSILRNARPDLLVTTGDIVDIPHWLSVARRELPILLRDVKPRLGFYASLGNHDKSDLTSILEQCGATVLRSRWARIDVDGCALNIGGTAGPKLWHYPRSTQALVRTLPESGTTIVLSHVPSAIWTLAGERVHVVLSGHTHAGQWRFGRFGCLWAHDDVPLHMAGGLHKIGPTHLFITAGLGESGPIPVRINCPPEVAVLTLRRAGRHGGA